MRKDTEVVLLRKILGVGGTHEKLYWAGFLEKIKEWFFWENIGGVLLRKILLGTLEKIYWAVYLEKNIGVVLLRKILLGYSWEIILECFSWERYWSASLGNRSWIFFLEKKNLAWFFRENILERFPLRLLHGFDSLVFFLLDWFSSKSTEFSAI